jgi:hypothetical protein
VLTKDDIEQFTSADLCYSPAIYQQRIQKHQELRITVIGEELFACEIETPPDSVQHIDWRIDDVCELPHRIVDIPEILATKLKCMLSIMGFNFGAFDVIADQSGTFYFIELNPNGQYYWIELLTGAPLTRAMSSLILRLASTISQPSSLQHSRDQA